MPAIPAPEPNISPATLPIRHHNFPAVKLRLQLNDLAHEGSSSFLSNTKGNEDLASQVQNVLNLLYLPHYPRPGTRSVTFILRDVGGVAYTTGSDLDDDHKEIHLSLGYIRNKPRHEILGVLCHELVHCFQWNGQGSCPGGLIEGIADYVRLRAGLGAKHWRREAGKAWDAGYQDTGYFLDWLERKFGPGTVMGINKFLATRRYHEEKLFAECCNGRKVHDLWEEYQEELKRDDAKQEEEHER